jgi:hypothetical protein
MKIQFKILAVALLSGVLAAPAFADDYDGSDNDGGAYVALNVGKGAIYPGCNTGFSNCKSYNQNVYFATYGYQYTPRWALELNYGKGGYISAAPSILALTLTGSAVGTVNLGDTLSVFAKVGLTYGDFRANGTIPAGYIFNPSGVSPSGGIGLQFNFTPHLSARVQGDFFGRYTVLTNAAKMNIVAATAGLMWRY